MNDNSTNSIDGFDHHDPEWVADPVPHFQEMRSKCPVAHTDEYGGFWMLSRYDDVKSGLLDWKTFTSSVVNTTAIPSTFERDFPALPNELDPPEHTRYRALFGATFRRSRIEGLRPAIEKVAHDQLAPMVAAGGGDLARDFATPISLKTLATLLSLPAEDEHLWVEWVDRMFDAINNPQDALDATADFYEYIDSLVAARRVNPRDDLISELLDAEVDGVVLTDEEVRGFVAVLLNAGHETTAGAMSGTMQYLAENPGHIAQLAENPDLIKTAVDEFVRYVSPIQFLARNTTCEVTMHDRVMAEGDVVAMSYASANRDIDAFDNPDEVDLARSPNRHLGFGAGIHLCLGAHVARLELTVALETLMDLVSSIRLDPDRQIGWKSRGDVRGLSSLPVLLVPR